MIMDSQLSFSSAQAITTASAASSNVSALDLSGGNSNIGNASRFGEDLGVGDGKNTPKIVVSVSTAFATSSGTPTINFQFQGSTNSSAWSTYIESGAIGTTALTKGSYWVFDWPQMLTPPLPRYVRMYYTLAGGTFSTGTIEANVVLNADGWVDVADQYPANYVVGA